MVRLEPASNHPARGIASLDTATSG